MPLTINRAYATSRYNLLLNGSDAGFISNIEGGDIHAEVINEPTGPDYFVHKHIGQPRYNDITLQMDLTLNRVTFSWLDNFWKGKTEDRSGVIQTIDAASRIKSLQEFHNAFVAETTIPACDAAVKEPAQLTLKLRPEYIRNKAGDNKPAMPSPVNSKRWLPSNFRLTIDGLDCSRVSAIDAFTVKTIFENNDPGELRDYVKTPGKLEFPNIYITLPESAATSWQAWFEDFVINGNCDEGKEKSGELAFLAPDMQTTLLRIKFFNLGIFRISKVKTAPDSNTTPKLRVALYCERMELALETVIG